MIQSMKSRFTFFVFVVLLTFWSVVADNSEFEDDDDFVGLFLRRRRRQLQSSTSESTRVNIFSKLKESLGMTIVGILLICVAPCLIWKNEHRHVMDLSRIDYCKNNATVVQADAPSTEYNEQLVHFTGAVTVDEHGLEFGNVDNKISNSNSRKDNDDKLNVASPIPKALLLKRTCYIYQKFEHAHQSTNKDMVGGGETRTTTYTLREAWTTAPQPPKLQHLTHETNSRGNWDAIVQACGAAGGGAAAGGVAASATAIPAGLLHRAPDNQSVSPAAHVGGFALSTEVIMSHPHVFATDWVPVPAEYLPSQIEGIESLALGKQEHGGAVANVLTDVSNGGPKNGNIKIVYEYVVDGFDCSFIVKQVAAAEPDVVVGAAGENDDGDASTPLSFGVQKYDFAVDTKCLGLCTTDLGEGWMIQKGRHDLPEMIQIFKQQESTMNTILRVICWILLLAGWNMLFAPFVTALQVLPLLSQLGGFAVFLVAFIVSCLCCNVVTLLAYLRFRPLLSGSLLALALGITGVVIWRLNQAAKTGGGDEEQ